MDTAALQQLGSTRVDWRFKGLPPGSEGSTVAELAAARANLFTDGFTTPVLTLDSEALRHNLELMARWTDAHGLAFAPHGKTPLAPQLYQRQLELGAWGITAAMPTHVRMYRAFGVQRVFLANELVDAAALTWLAAELDADPDFEFVCYVDSRRGIELMLDALDRADARRRVDVVVELGANGARTGVRGLGQALDLAAAVAESGRLRLVGVAGYEGTISNADSGRREVRDWLAELVELAHRIDAAGLFADTDRIVVSAGGSEHFDLVAEALTAEALKLSRPTLRLLRSGAYVTHDDLHYAEITPLRSAGPEQRLRPALRLWAQVVSRPEPGLALLNAGKRDLPYDLGLPVPSLIRSADDGGVRPAAGLRVRALADQHAFVDLGSDAGAGPQVGDWVALQLSHPCTAFEKWQLIPEVQPDGTVTDYIRTFF